MNNEGINNKKNISGCIVPPEFKVIIYQQGNNECQWSEVTKEGSNLLQSKIFAILSIAGYNEHKTIHPFILFIFLEIKSMGIGTVVKWWATLG